MGLCVKCRQIFRHTRLPVSAIFAGVFSFISIDIRIILSSYIGTVSRPKACSMCFILLPLPLACSFKEPTHGGSVE
jgi:hypothetical protein